MKEEDIEGLIKGQEQALEENRGSDMESYLEGRLSAFEDIHDILKEENKKMKPEEEKRIYYVSMTDRFMSGWGDAKGKINKLVFVCKSYEEAKIVEDNARNRTDQKYINIRTKKPYYNKDRYYTQFKGVDDYDAWYVPNYFRDKVRI